MMAVYLLLQNKADGGLVLVSRFPLRFSNFLDTKYTFMYLSLFIFKMEMLVSG